MLIAFVKNKIPSGCVNVAEVPFKKTLVCDLDWELEADVEWGALKPPPNVVAAVRERASYGQNVAISLTTVRG